MTFSKKFWIYSPYIALLAAHTIWGGNYVAAKLTLQEIPTMTTGFIRFSLAFLLILPFLLTEKNKTPIALADLPRLVLIGLLMVVLNIALFFEGVSRIPVTNASAITMSGPALSVLFGWLFLKEKIYLFNLFGLIMGLVGALVIIGIPLLLVGLGADSQVLLGNLMIVGSSILWVSGILLAKEMMPKYGILTITTLSFFIGSVCFFIPAVYQYLNDSSWTQHVTALGIMGMAYMVVLSSVSAFFLLDWGLSKLPLGRASIFQYIEPLIATTLGVTLLNERISYSFIVGAIMIGLGVYWGTLGKEKHHRVHKAHRI